MMKRSLLSPISEQPPRHLSAESKQWFQTIISLYQLDPSGLSILRICAESWDDSQRARATIGKLGATYKDRYGNPRQRPEVKVLNDARLVFLKSLRLLNLDQDAPALGLPHIPSRGRK